MPYVTDEVIGNVVSTVPHAGNRRTLDRYLAERRAHGVKPASLHAQANHIRKFLQFLDDRPVETTTKDDVLAFVSEDRTVRFYRHGVSREVVMRESTRAARIVQVRAFLKWLRRTPGRAYPPEVEWLQPNRKAQSRVVDPAELLTPKEVKAMVQAHDHPQDRAIVSVLYESGMRASEFVSLTLGNVAVDDHGEAVLALSKASPGLKTGPRRVPLLDSVVYLQAWLDAHPRKGDASAALWISRADRNPGDPLTANALWRIIKKGAERAAIKKRVYPHVFRHSRATEAVRLGYPDAITKKLFGWTARSDTPSVYQHVNDEDVREFARRVAGKSRARAAERALEPRVCARCEKVNAATADFCARKECGRPLTPMAAEKASVRRIIDQFKDDSDGLDDFARLILSRSVAAAKRRA